MRERLIKKPENLDDARMKSRFMHESAYYIEQNLIAAGATPGKDYNLLDCFYLASLFNIAVHMCTLPHIRYDDDNDDDEDEPMINTTELNVKPHQNIAYQ